MAKTVAALFENGSEAYGAVKDLLEHGFTHDDISVVSHDATSSDHDLEDEDGISGVAGVLGLAPRLGGGWTGVWPYRIGRIWCGTGDGGWSAFEPETQLAWERDHPGTWEQFKIAIRHAWDEVRGHR